MSVSEPGKIITPWAESGLKNPIPPAANPATGRAGFDQGFSAINMTAKEAGGIPPFGQDFNDVIYNKEFIDTMDLAMTYDTQRLMRGEKKAFKNYQLKHVCSVLGVPFTHKCEALVGVYNALKNTSDS